MKRARNSFAFAGKDGTNRFVSSDDIYPDDHPYVRAYPTCFADLEEEMVTVPVEQATAAPGEKRNTRR